MSSDSLHSVYSRTRDVLKRIITKHNDAVDIATTMPETDRDEMRSIHLVIDDMELCLKSHIPAILAQLRGQPKPPCYRFHSEDFDFRPPFETSLDPSFEDHLFALGNGLSPLVTLLRENSPPLEKILLDLEKLLMQELPHLRAAITRETLDEETHGRLYGNAEANQVRDSQAAVGAWLQAFPNQMANVKRLPPYFPEDEMYNDIFSSSSSDYDTSSGVTSDNGYCGASMDVAVNDQARKSLQEEEVKLMNDTFNSTGKEVIDLTLDDDDDDLMSHAEDKKPVERANEVFDLTGKEVIYLPDSDEEM